MFLDNRCIDVHPDHSCSTRREVSICCVDEYGECKWHYYICPLVSIPQLVHVPRLNVVSAVFTLHSELSQYAHSAPMVFFKFDVDLFLACHLVNRNGTHSFHFVLSVWTIGCDISTCTTMACNCTKSSLGFHIWSIGLGWSTHVWMPGCSKGSLGSITIQVSLHSHQGRLLCVISSCISI